MAVNPNQHDPAMTARGRLTDGEMRLRVVSALALGVVALAALWTGPLPFACLVAGIGTIMCWEWGHAVRSTNYDLPLGVHIAAVVAAVVLTYLGYRIIALAVLLAGVASIIVICRGARRVRSKVLSPLGVVYIGIPAMVLLWLRQDGENGFWAVLFIFVMVWTHDTFAMLIGKAVGGPRLWPRLSPNKTWAGLIGGLSASTIAGAAYGLLLPLDHWVQLAGVGFVLGLAAFAGDLAESALKRRYGMKNTSNLIPGHGGFMDRLDGAVAAAIVAALIAIAVNFASPANGLLLLR
ncbi:MAG TPA: phosphatidate cytidylyltransferase [Hyphomicrobiaceae bacterium]|nr:phosphatidate cytidylyltransferase [Hyphomicrobiaceae bacterium]